MLVPQIGEYVIPVSPVILNKSSVTSQAPTASATVETESTKLTKSSLKKAFTIKVNKTG